MRVHLLAILMASPLWPIYGPAKAEPAGVPPPVTLELKAVPSQAALAALFNGTGRRYFVEPTLPDVPVSLSVIHVDFVAALRALLGLMGATYWKEGTIYMIGLRPTIPGEKTWTLDFRGTPLRRALTVLAQKSSLRYSIAPDVPNVPIYLHLKTPNPGHEAYLLADLAGAETSGGLESTRITMSRPSGPAPTATQPERWEWLRKRITLHLEGVSSAEALAVVLRAAGKEYRIAPDLPGGSLTVSVRNVDWVTVLESVGRISGTEFAREGETYVIRRAK